VLSKPEGVFDSRFSIQHTSAVLADYLKFYNAKVANYYHMQYHGSYEATMVGGIISNASPMHPNQGDSYQGVHVFLEPRAECCIVEVGHVGKV